MRLKSFQAKTMSEAMRQVKETLGDDAIIVSTREEAGYVRITAAIEQENTHPEPLQPSAPVQTFEEFFDEEAAVEEITDTLLKHRVPAAVSDKIISSAMTCTARDTRDLLAQALGHTFRFAPLPPSRILALVGPPGAGKTLMTAKMAAHYVLDGRKPSVITTDIARAGGIEQLQAFLDILSLPLLQAENAKDLKAAINKSAAASHVIIDTGGLNPFDAQEMKTLAQMLMCEKMESALVLPAGMDAEEAAEMAMTFSILGVRNFLPTRLDFARRLGGILSAADKAGLTFIGASHTPAVANGIIPMDPLTLAKFLMPGGSSSASSHTDNKRGKQ